MQNMSLNKMSFSEYWGRWDPEKHHTTEGRGSISTNLC